MSSPYDDDSLWHDRMREIRHNPCLMSPVSVVFLILFGLFWLVTAALQVPALLLGFLLSPILQRSIWYVEFLYPTNIAKWAHLFLVRYNGRSRTEHADDKNRGYHSRTVEQRIEVIPDRVYIHPIPQFLDNIGYLVVQTPLPRRDKPKKGSKDAMVGFLVDCGEPDAVIEHVNMIRELHYPKHRLHIQAILATHKHHDHTAGIRQVMADPKVGKYICSVVGGAVEKVPFCDTPVVDGDLLSLPRSGHNDMNEFLQVEAVAVPGHTRGSITYLLRPITTDAAILSFLFTGDTMFSGGGGVPFEADVPGKGDTEVANKSVHSRIRPSAGNNAIERCFAELLSRSVKRKLVIGEDGADRILIFPGHEYTAELLNRQFQSTAGENCKWKNFPPAAFFETVSQLYIANHRRSLPHSSGTLLTVPSPISREVLINPIFRTMRKRGEHVIRAVRLWHAHFSQTKRPDDNVVVKSSAKMPTIQLPPKTVSRANKWNLDADDVTRSIFTTVYSADLMDIVDGLETGELAPKKAAKKLKMLRRELETPVVGRRPVPATLPSEKNMFRAIMGFAMLGSRPSAMTFTDSIKMKLPEPIDANSDHIPIVRKRLIEVLNVLGLLNKEDEGDMVVAMIDLLWSEAKQYGPSMSDIGRSVSYDSADTEDTEQANDEVDLGILKWMIYGAEFNQPSWFSRFCMMCKKSDESPEMPEHPAEKMRQKNGELIRHDVETCLLCRDAAGCPEMAEEDDSEYAASKSRYSSRDDDEDGETGIETVVNPSFKP